MNRYNIIFIGFCLCGIIFFYIPIASSTLFDSIGFGVSADINSGGGGGGGDYFDSIGFGVYVDIGSGGGGGGTSPWSTVWELYHLDHDRCDYDVSGSVNIFDTSACYINQGVSDYLYDCNPLYSGDDVVNIFDVSLTYIHQGVA